MTSIGKLRPMQEGDLECVLSWRNSPAVRQNMYVDTIIELEEHKRWWSSVAQSSGCKYFMYEDQGFAQGVVGFTNIDKAQRTSAWAFYASPQAKKGCGSKMEFLALEHAFSEIKLHKLYCEVLAFNEAVIKLHQKFGFTIEGVFREQYFRDGRFIDIYRLGILRSEWLSNSAKMSEKILRLSKGH